MKKLLFLAAVVGLMGLQSCSSYKVSKTFTASNIITANTEVLMADLEVGDKHITGTFSVEVSRHKQSNLTSERMVLTAVYDALQKVNADAIVCLQHKVTSEFDSKSGVETRTVHISGYPVYYKNFRPVPVVQTEFDVRELKPETPYVIVEKNTQEGEKGYRVITSTKIKNQPIIPLDEVALEKLVINGDKKDKKSDDKGGSKGRSAR